MHSISFALSFTQEFLVGYSSQSQFLHWHLKEQLVLNQIVQGVCSCFSLFNLQGTPAIRTAYLKSHPDFIGLAPSVPEQLLHYSTHCSACQALFSKFFNFFLKPKFQSKSLVFGLLMSFLSSRVSLSRWQLIYNIMPKLICQHLFWKKSRFFSKKWEIPTFPLYYAGFRREKLLISL